MLLAAAGVATPTGRASEGAGAEAEAWFWRSQLPTSSGLAVPAPDPDGHLPVAAVAGEWEKVVLLRPREIPADGTLRLTLTAPGDAAGGDVLRNTAALAACLVAEPWAAMAAAAWDLLPAIDCDTASSATLEPTADGGLVATFDLRPLVRAWAYGAPEFGTAVVPDPGATARGGTWQITFRGSPVGGVAFEADAEPPAAAGPVDRAASQPVTADVTEHAAPASLALPGFGLPTPPASPSDPDRRDAAPSRPPPTGSVTRILPFDRDVERVRAAALTVLTLVLLLAALGPLPSRSGRLPRPLDSRHCRAAIALWLAAAMAILFAWSGAAGQVLVAAQVPYLVSGGLVAAVLTLAGAAILVAGGLRQLPRTHPLARLLRRRLPAA